jgi:hypothetical protein
LKGQQKADSDMTHPPALPTQPHPDSPNLHKKYEARAIAMQNFIEAGERELEGLENEDEREKRSAQLHTELLRRFPLKNKDDEDAHYQAAFDREDEDSTHADYEEGDGEGKDHFRSHLQVKCLDSVKQPTLTCDVISGDKKIGEVVFKPLPVNQFPETIEQGPDYQQVMRRQGLAFQEYPSTGPYHDRLASLIAQHARTPKHDLECQRCGEGFEGRKGTMYCSDCRRRKKAEPVVEHVPGECACDTCKKVYNILVALEDEYLTNKYGTEERGPSFRLTKAEEKYLMRLAKQQVEESSE